MNFWEIIFLFFAFQAVIFSILILLRNKGERIANYLLILYTLLFGFNIVYNVLYWSKLLYTINYINILYTNIMVWSLYGPILFLYVRRVVKKTSFKLFDLVHFALFLLVFFRFSKLLFLSATRKIEVIRNGTWQDYILLPTINLIYILIPLMFLYVILIFRLQNEEVSRNIKRWMSWLSFSYLGYVLSFTAYFVLRNLGFIEIEYDYFIGYSMIFFVAMVTYFGFVQPEVFDGHSMDQVIPLRKYLKTGLTEDHSLELKNRLEDYMHTDKPFLNSELRLDTFAEELNLSRHHTSQVINEHFDTNFFDYINSYRINEAKKLLLDSNSTLNITDILYACGFNNRVSFYKAFKKFAGTTPSEYKLQPNNAS